MRMQADMAAAVLPLSAGLVDCNGMGPLLRTASCCCRLTSPSTCTWCKVMFTHAAPKEQPAQKIKTGHIRRGTRNSVYIVQASEIELGLQREPQAHVTRTHWRIRKTVCTLVNVLKKHTLHSGRSGDLAFCSVPLRATHVVCSPCCLPDTRLHAGASQSAAGSTQTLSARCCC